MTQTNLKKYLGVDIGGTAVKIGVVTSDGVARGIRSYNVFFDNYETPILTAVIKSIKQYLKDNNISEKELDGIGVSATGGIDTEKGIVAGAAGHIKNWVGSRIVYELEHEFRLHTSVLNDANAAALGELWVGAAHGKRNVIVVTVGTGVGGGIISDGKILLGNHGFAGEIGHFPVQCKGEKCSCGNTGCLEHYASTTALVKMVQRAVENKEISFDNNEINGKTIFEQIENGNAKLEKVLEDWMDYLISGIVGLVHVFNPELVLIGGGVSAQEELFIQKVREKVLERVMPDFSIDLDVRAAQLGNEAGLIGAVYFLGE